MPLRRNRARKEVQPKELATGPLRRYKSFLEFYHDMFVPWDLECSGGILI